MMTLLYQKVLKPFLFLFNPDQVHDVFIKIGVLCDKVSFLKYIVELFYGKPPKGLKITVDGINYPGPVLLSAGFDYNGLLSPILHSIGFAGEEVGSVTARLTKGNPRPHLKRLIRSGSIQVYKGLKNDGVDTVIQRLKSQQRSKDFVLGVSIAKTNDKSCVVLEEGIKDYCYSLKRLVEENVGDFYTINISCPNAFGGEDFASPQNLRLLLSEITKIKCSRPIYLKMPINKNWEEFQPLVDLVIEFELQGVVIGNLNKNYNDLEFSDEVDTEYRGGLSGRPCFKLSNELIRITRKHYPKLTIIGSGGIMSAEDALAKLEAGANLVQLITGMIFTGPQLINDINKSYLRTHNKQGV